MNKLLTALLLTSVLVTPAHASRNYVWSVGSSTVFPFSSAVSENFARKTGYPVPKVESLGTGGGFKLFCGGSGSDFPDIANASRPIKPSERAKCAANGVKNLVEIKIGYDGIVVASDKRGPTYNLKLEYLHLGLSQTVLRFGSLVPNPVRTWNQIAKGLPTNRIVVYGPPPTSGTRDAFLELGIEAGAARLSPLLTKEVVSPLSSNWIDAGENDNALVQTIQRTPGSVGVFGYSFYAENKDKIKAASIEGIQPSPATITSGAYPLSRSLYIYVKKDNIGVTPGLDKFITEFKAASARGGYLQSKGLIPSR